MIEGNEVGVARYAHKVVSLAYGSLNDMWGVHRPCNEGVDREGGICPPVPIYPPDMMGYHVGGSASQTEIF